ncbi:MAG: DUF1573 domain-containing protein [Anaerolineaceae bacterium]|nr:DUF1573 domain-containing protein [Anaerolineaceae bacterium]
MSKSKKKNLKKNGISKELILGLVFGALLFVILILFFALQNKPSTSFTPDVTGGPSLKVDKELIDFGEVKLGTEVSASFQITNIGDQPLRFTEKPYITLLEGC